MIEPKDRTFARSACWSLTGNDAACLNPDGDGPKQCNGPRHGIVVPEKGSSAVPKRILEAANEPQGL